MQNNVKEIFRKLHENILRSFRNILHVMPQKRHLVKNEFRVSETLLYILGRYNFEIRNFYSKEKFMETIT